MLRALDEISNDSEFIAQRCANNRAAIQRRPINRRIATILPMEITRFISRRPRGCPTSSALLVLVFDERMQMRAGRAMLHLPHIPNEHDRASPRTTLTRLTRIEDIFNSQTADTVFTGSRFEKSSIDAGTWCFKVK